MECDICGEALDDAGPLGKVTCDKCGLVPMCERCASIHSHSGCGIFPLGPSICNDWELVGFISVDSGTVQIGDPCYDYNKKDKRDWGTFCSQINGATTTIAHETGRHGKAIVVCSFGGDGAYPVYIKRGTESEIAEMKVVFYSQSHGEGQ